jgi:hypothetical protein
VVGHIIHLREGDFQVAEGDRSRVCWRRLAGRTEETPGKGSTCFQGILQRP